MQKESAPFLTGHNSQQRTGRFFTDANGKAWPIYRQKSNIDPGPLVPNAAQTTAHGQSVKADGYFRMVHAQITKDGSPPILANGDQMVAKFNGLTHIEVRMNATTDASTYTSGFTIYEFCKSTD